MKIIDLQFTIELPYDRTWYKPLIDIAIESPFKGNGGYVWKFPINRLKDVSAITGYQIKISEDDFLLLDEFKEVRMENSNTEKFKGKGKYIVTKMPTGYQLSWYQKVENDEGEFEITKPKHEVSTNMLQIAFKVVSKYPIGKFIKSRTIGENICNELGITRFNRESGTFDWDKFFGSRSSYFKYFYYPMKVLECLGCIHYHKSGKIKRLVEVMEFQTRLDFG